MNRGRYETGLSAEDAVIRHYVAQGAKLLAQRMRNAGGEIDLIFEAGDTILFVEVKARRNRDEAAEALSPAQAARIWTAAEIWLDKAGRSTLHPSRVDLATVDGIGAVEVIENILV